MHELFSNRDVLSSILIHLSDESLASYTVVSKCFHEAALAVVWRDATPSRIWQLFPEDMIGIGVDNTLELVRPINHTTRDRIYRRTKHSRIFTYHQESNGSLDCLLAVLLFRPSLSLFPSLFEVNFEVRSANSFHAICLVMPESLRAVRLTFFLDDLVPELTVPTPLMQLLGALCGIIYDCLHYVSPVFALLDRFLTSFLEECTTMKELKLRDIPYTAPLFKSIGSLPSLPKLEWKPQVASESLLSLRGPIALSDFEGCCPSPFFSLRSWSLNLNLDAVIDVYPDKGFIGAFITLTRLSCIQSIVLSMVGTKEYVHTVVEAIANNCPKLEFIALSAYPPLETRQHVHVPSSVTIDDIKDPQTWDRFTFACYRPLLKCDKLQILHLSVFEHYSFVFTDKDLSEMRAWRWLRVLRVTEENSSCACEPAQVTNMGLIALLLACPALQEVAIEMNLDPLVHPNLLRIWNKVLAKSQHCCLRIGNAYIRNPEQVAVLLRTIAPNVENIGFGPLRLPDAQTFQSGTDEEINMRIAGTEAELERIKNARNLNRLLEKTRFAKHN
ncbi:hypothetical protein DACRYDRAFT_111206 [Dacryopinax primogenitus]|uniref:F-box domain-containing protein n=1 Tax=Dacryopinax primogenitus (strain DJM 731) TaxID=1858805 RepID=M5FXL2_DACPD|nr:uncharacterized protein DACRYDRAFT_111206 [Dacryopinax primogenitus]EJT98236.1 hypothetical protein DACRYDRAFT_111206 [Dacryopinax primogenitus]